MGEASVQKEKHDQRRDKHKDQMGDHEFIFKFHVVQEVVHDGTRCFLHDRAPL